MAAPAQPDPIVLVIGGVELEFPAVGGDWLGVVEEQILEDLGGVGRVAPGGLEDFAHLGVTPLQPE